MPPAPPAAARSCSWPPGAARPAGDLRPPRGSRPATHGGARAQSAGQRRHGHPPVTVPSVPSPGASRGSSPSTVSHHKATSRSNSGCHTPSVSRITAICGRGVMAFSAAATLPAARTCTITPDGAAPAASRGVNRSRPIHGRSSATRSSAASNCSCSSSQATTSSAASSGTSTRYRPSASTRSRSRWPASPRTTS